MGHTILKNYDGFDARLGAFIRDFNSRERKQLEEGREKLKELTLAWKQKYEEDKSTSDRVQEILVEQLDERDEQIAPDAITLEAKFIEDLGMDSLELVELAMALEEEVGNEIPDEDAEKPASRNTILIGSILFALWIIVGCDSGENNSYSDSDRENNNLTPEQPASTNAPTQPNPTGNPPENSGDPLQKAIRDQGNLKSALESLHADATFDSEGNLLRLGLDSLPVTDDAVPVIAKQTRLRALYLFDTKISDAGLKQLAGLKELKILMLTGSPVTSSGIDQLQMSLPNCVIIP